MSFGNKRNSRFQSKSGGQSKGPTQGTRKAQLPKIPNFKPTPKMTKANDELIKQFKAEQIFISEKPGLDPCRCYSMGAW